MLDIEKLSQKCQEAFDKRNYDYAIDLAKQILEVSPENPRVRQILRNSVIENYKLKEGFVPTGIKASLRSFLPLIKIIFSSIVSKNPLKLIGAYEEYLAKNPMSIKARTKLATLLKNMKFIDSAIGEFEGVLSIDPRNVSAAKALGELYQTKLDIPKAQHYYKMVLSLDPTDLDAPRALKDLAAITTIQEGGWASARTSRDLIRDKTKAVELEKESQLIKDAEIDNEIERLQNLVKQNPENIQNVTYLKKIGELYLRKNDFTSALEAYRQAFLLNPSDGQLTLKIGDIHLARYDMEIHQLQQELAKNPGNSILAQQLTAKRQEKLKFQIEEFQRRIKMYPTDMSLHFQLGLAYYSSGQIDEAITEFQTAVRDPKRRIDSYNQLGKCFLVKKHYDLAIEQFKNALEIEALTTAQMKEIRYNLAYAYEQANNREAALAEYKKILAVDYNYKDVAKRVERLKLV